MQRVPELLNRMRRRAWRLARADGPTGSNGAEHDRRRIQTAADAAIAAAHRARLAVTVADVQHRATEDFGLTVVRAEAAAILRTRLSRTPDLPTDAFEDPSPAKLHWEGWLP